MNCELISGLCRNCGGVGPDCSAEITIDDVLAMEAGRIPPRAVRLTGVQAAALAGQATLTAEEIAELLPGDPTLAGNRLERLFKAIGIPPCGACGSRRDWLNRAHLWLQSLAA